MFLLIVIPNKTTHIYSFEKFLFKQTKMNAEHSKKNAYALIIPWLKAFALMISALNDKLKRLRISVVYSYTCSEGNRALINGCVY